MAHGVLDNLELFHKCRPFQEKRELRSVIWGPFRATGTLCAAFFTGFGFLRIRVNLKENDCCAECFDANFLSGGQLRTVFSTSFSFLIKETTFD